MLVEFSISNFKSIRDEVTLSMVATNDSSLSDNVIQIDDNRRILKSAGIFGPNASGKTTVLEAFHRLSNSVRTSHLNTKGDRFQIEPFKLDEEMSKKPTIFRIVFIKNGIRYCYGLSLTKEKVIEEYLFWYPKGIRAMIFHRTDTSHFEFNKDKSKQTPIGDRTLENVLYLSSSTQQNYQGTLDAFNWFRESLWIIGPGGATPSEEHTARQLYDNPSIREKVLRAIVKADLGISDMDITCKEQTVDEYCKNIPLKDEYLKEIKDDLMKFGEDKIKTHEIRLVHHGLDRIGGEFRVALEKNEESHGTMRLFRLIGFWIRVLDEGGTLVIDEIDSSLHPVIGEFLVAMFHDPVENKGNGQLIFTSHDSNLLNQSLFRRDQIWFTEKNPDTGNTILYPLSTYKPRKDKDIQRGYFIGKYGALPFIPDLKVMQ